jgi:hypothetical protein
VGAAGGSSGSSGGGREQKRERERERERERGALVGATLRLRFEARHKKAIARLARPSLECDASRGWNWGRAGETFLRRDVSIVADVRSFRRPGDVSVSRAAELPSELPSEKPRKSARGAAVSASHAKSRGKAVQSISISR